MRNRRVAWLFIAICGLNCFVSPAEAQQAGWSNSPNKETLQENNEVTGSKNDEAAKPAGSTSLPLNPVVPSSEKSNSSVSVQPGLTTPVLKSEPNAENRFSGLLDQVPTEYIVTAWLVVVVLGILLGITEKLIVFRDFNDLFLVFLTCIGIVATLYLLTTTKQGEPPILVGTVFGLTVAVLLWIVGRTISDNRNLLLFPIALITKLTLSVFFLVVFIDFVTPTGKTMAKRASKRHVSFIGLLLLAPLIFALVRNKEGIFNPMQSLGGKFRARI